MGCFVVAEFLLTSASRGPSAIAEPLVSLCSAASLNKQVTSIIIRSSRKWPVGTDGFNDRFVGRSVRPSVGQDREFRKKSIEILFEMVG